MWTDKPTIEAAMVVAEGSRPSNELGPLWDAMPDKGSVGDVASRLIAAPDIANVIFGAATDIARSHGVTPEQILTEMVAPAATRLLPNDLAGEYEQLIHLGPTIHQLPEDLQQAANIAMDEFMRKLANLPHEHGGGLFGILGGIIGGLVASVIGAPAIVATLVGVGVELVAEEIAESAGM